MLDRTLNNFAKLSVCRFKAIPATLKVNLCNHICRLNVTFIFFRCIVGIYVERNISFSVDSKGLLTYPNFTSTVYAKVIDIQLTKRKSLRKEVILPANVDRA